MPTAFPFYFPAWFGVDPDRDQLEVAFKKYHGLTKTYFRYANGEDLAFEADFSPSAFEHNRQMITFENQLLGPIKAFNSIGTFIHLPGTFEQKHSPTSLIVMLSGFDGVIDRTVVGKSDEFAWSGLNPATPNWLWSCLVEEPNETGIFRSSAMKGDWDAMATTTADPPAGRQCLLQATFQSGLGINSTPYGKVFTIPSLYDHVNNNINPHGTSLFFHDIVVDDIHVQSAHSINSMVVSGTIINHIQAGLSGLGINKLDIANTLNISGTFIEHGNLQLYADHILYPDDLLNALDRVTYGVIGSLTDTGTLTSQYTTIFNTNLNITSGKAIDGYDVSAEGTKLDNHIVNYSNPHYLTSGYVPEALSTYGGILRGNLLANSGISIGGLDYSELAQYMGGGEITRAGHLHNISSGINYFGFAPESSSYVAITGTSGVNFTHVSNTNVTSLSGVNSLVIAHCQHQLPDDLGTPIYAKIKHGVLSTISGLEAVHNGKFGTNEVLNGTLPSLAVAMGFNELAGTRYNGIPDGVGPWTVKVAGGSTSVIPGVAGLVGNAADFENSGFAQVLQIPFTIIESSRREVFRDCTKATISFWIKPESTASTMVILNEPSSFGIATPRVQVSVDSANKLIVKLQRLTGSLITINGTNGQITDSVWNHVVIILDMENNAYEFWVNNVQKNAGAISEAGALDPYQGFGALSYTDPPVGLTWGGIGNVQEGAPSSSFDGLLDIGLVWNNDALNNIHINELYNSGNGIEFGSSSLGSLTFMLKDASNNLYKFDEFRNRRDSVITSTLVDIDRCALSKNTEVDFQFVLSGVDRDDVMFGPLSMQYSTVAYTPETTGVLFATTSDL